MSRKQDDDLDLALVASLGAGASGAGLRFLNNLQNFDQKPTLGKRSYRNKIKPGDVVFHDSPDFRLGGTPISTKGVVASFTGDPAMHASISVGRGGMVEAKGQGQNAHKAYYDDLKDGQAVEIYRHKDPVQRAKAIEYAKQAKDAPYKSGAGMAGYALDQIFNIGSKPSCKNPGKGQLCTNIVANAYDKSFDRENISRADIKKNPNFELVGRAGKHTASAAEKFGALAVNPALHGLKWAALAGLTGLSIEALRKMMKEKNNDT